MLRQRFDLGRVDVLAAGDDHVLYAVDHETFLVHVARVAGAQPAVNDGSFGLLGLAPVAQHHARPARDDFAGLAARHFLHLLIDDADVGAWCRLEPAAFFA